jgi:hypothetical protein
MYKNVKSKICSEALRNFNKQLSINEKIEILGNGNNNL